MFIRPTTYHLYELIPYTVILNRGDVRFQLLGTPSVMCEMEATAPIAAISGSPAVRATIERNVTTL